MDRHTLSYVLDGLVLVGLVWYGFILVYCYLSHFRKEFDAAIQKIKGDGNG